ncbi:MAG: DNA-binding protein WhiA [Lachnospiraceae bacterium]|nr:DNA-binding protein WhiA [Lachnospiraceae bacterium]
MSFAGKVKEELSGKKRREKDKDRQALRDAFLSSGTMSDPEKSYHFELSFRECGNAEEMLTVMEHLSLSGKIMERKGQYVVYLKESDEISDALKLMGAYRCCMEFENARILKDMRNSVNRKVNCETANIHKTVGAAVRQLEDIRLIEETIGFSELPEPLREMAEIRTRYPDATLAELGGYFQPPVGKSGVNHRLRKIAAIAEKLRDHTEKTPE